MVTSLLDFPTRDPHSSSGEGAGKALPLPWSDPSLARDQPSLRASPAPLACGSALRGTDSAPSALAGTPAALCLQDNTSLVPEIPEVHRFLPGLSRAPGAKAAEIAEGRWPRPLHSPALPAPPPLQPPSRAGVPDPGPSLLLSLPPRLPGAATVAGRRIPASQLVPASSPSSSQNKHPSPRLRSPDRPLPPSARRAVRDSVRELARAGGRAP